MSNYHRAENEDFGTNTESKGSINTSVEQGRCAKCGSDNVDYGSSELDGEGIYYEMACVDCGVDMHEYYSLTFEGIDVLNPEGDYATIEYLPEGDEILDERETEERFKKDVPE